MNDCASYSLRAHCSPLSRAISTHTHTAMWCWIELLKPNELSSPRRKRCTFSMNSSLRDIKHVWVDIHFFIGRPIQRTICVVLINWAFNLANMCVFFFGGDQVRGSPAINPIHICCLFEMSVNWMCIIGLGCGIVFDTKNKFHWHISNECRG